MMKQEGSVSWVLVSGPAADEIDCPKCGRRNGAALHEAVHYYAHGPVQCGTGLEHIGYICYCGWRSDRMCNTTDYNRFLRLK